MQSSQTFFGLLHLRVTLVKFIRNNLCFNLSLYSRNSEGKDLPDLGREDLILELALTLVQNSLDTDSEQNNSK